MTAGVGYRSTWREDDRSVTFSDPDTIFGLPDEKLRFLVGVKSVKTISLKALDGRRVPVEELPEVTRHIFNRLSNLNDHGNISFVVVGEHSITLEVSQDAPGIPVYMCRLLDMAISLAV